MTVIWRQWIDGFDAETESAGCTTTVDSAATGRDKNKVTSEIASAINDRATADVTNLSKLPQGDQGRLRFKVKFHAFPVGDPWHPTANVTFGRLANPDPVQLIEIYADADKDLGGFSQANTLRSTSLNAVNLGNMIVDQEYTIEFAWKGATDSTGFRRIWLDETLVNEVLSLDMVATNDCDISELALGFHHYDGADPEGLRCEIRWAQLSDDPTEILVDPVEATTLYTVPEDARAVIRHIYANNPSGAPVNITLSIGEDDDATHIFDNDPVPANSSISARRETNYVLEAGEVLQGYASTANTVVLVIDGVEYGV